MINTIKKQLKSAQGCQRSRAALNTKNTSTSQDDRRGANTKKTVWGVDRGGGEIREGGVLGKGEKGEK